MHPFAYARATSIDEAIATVARNKSARYIAGGTNIVDLMFDVVERPSTVVDINALPLGAIEKRPDVLRIGALARMSDTADHADVRAVAPFVAEALDASASAQLRNAATIGGNVLQRTRCSYFRDVTQPCNKREPGTGCAALGGENRMNAILGASDTCIATHPSDLAVALAASDATIETLGPAGRRSIPIADFYVKPLHDPSIENVLHHGELITSIDIPIAPALAKSHYLKVRDRQSYEFALVSVAIALETDGGAIRDVRLAFGGVGTVPWRSHEAERALAGKPATREAFESATEIAMSGAQGRGHNDFKIPLMKRAVAAALAKVTA
jgi:xanthine dehydrogenase YagS FAD-binding subunit